MLSSRGMDIIKKVDSATYDIIIQDRRIDPTISTTTFTFKKPLEEGSVREDEFVELARTLITNNLDLVGNILFNLGISEKKPKNRASGKINFTYDEEIASEDPKKVGIRLINGRFASITNVRGLLEIATKRYMLKAMNPAGSSGILKNRTGRFINSTKLHDPRVDNVNNNVSLYFTYMLYPYQVFDPYYIGRTKNTHLASEERNPRKIIGEALLKAARDLLSAKYKIKIAQGGNL